MVRLYVRAMRWRRDEVCGEMRETGCSAKCLGAAQFDSAIIIILLQNMSVRRRSLNYAYLVPKGISSFRADLGSLRPAVGRRALREASNR